MSSAVVLSSGGINSAVVLEIALRAHRPDTIHMVSFKYGSDHNEQERLASLDLYHYYRDRDENVTWDQIALPDLFKGTNPPLLDATLLSMATTYAVINSIGFEYNGMTKNDVHDIRDMHNVHDVDFHSFFKSIGDVIYFGSENGVELKSPLSMMNKVNVIRRAYDLEVPINLTWSCHQPTRHFPHDESKLANSALIHCGICLPCIDRINGFKELGFVDPVPYAIEVEWDRLSKAWPHIGEKQLRAGKL